MDQYGNQFVDRDPISLFCNLDLFYFNGVRFVGKDYMKMCDMFI